MLFHCGDICTGMHAVAYGQIKLSVISPLGGEKVVRLVGPGDSFGEALMFLGKPYLVSAQALAASLLLHVAKAAIAGELRADPDFACKMLAGMRARGLLAVHGREIVIPDPAKLRAACTY
jgi:CRP-like cAMP-binding protein